MALERKWAKVPPQLLISNGNSQGQIQIALAYLFKVGQTVILSSNTQESIELKVARIPDENTIWLTSESSNQVINLSSYLVSDTATIQSNEQPRSSKSPDDVIRSIYDEEPTMAMRALLVDRAGNDFAQSNESPLYVYDQETHNRLDNIDCRIDVNNSTNSNLADGEVFYGPWTERTTPDIIVAMLADQDLTFYMQFANTELSTTLGVPVYNAGSAAGIDSSIPFTYTAGEIFIPKRRVIARQWYRLVIVNNSGSDTTFLRCQTSIGTFDNLEIPLNQSLPLDTDAITTRAIQAGIGPNNVYVNQRQSGYVNDLTTQTPLGANESFESPIIDCTGYSQISTGVFTDQPGTLVGTWYADSDGIIALRTFSVPVPSLTELRWLSSVVFSQYFKFSFINGATPQSSFYLRSQLDTNPKSGQMLGLEDFIPNNSLVNLNRVVTAGKNPNDVYTNTRVQGAHDGNTTNVALDANTTYRGEWFNIQDNGYVKAITSLTADVPGTLYLDITNVDNPTNGDDSDLQGFIPFPYDPVNSPIFRRQSVIQSKWVRHRYINGNAAQSVFNLEGSFVISDPGIESQPLRDIPTGAIQAGIVRSVGTIPTADLTGFQNVPVDSLTGNPTTTIQNVRDDILLKSLNIGQARQVSVGITPTRLDPNPVTDRREVMISNDGDVPASIGFSNSITYESNSFVMKPGAVRTWSLAESIELWGIAQDVGGTQTTYNNSPSSATGTATSPSNVLASNNTRAIIDTNGELVNATGYVAGTSNDIVSVRLGLEARKETGQTEVTSIQEVQSGATAGAGTVTTSSPMAGGVNQLYVAYITRNSNSNSITQVQADGVFLSPLITNITSGNRRIDVWYGYGTFSAGNVTANMTTSTNAHIAVYRIDNADPDNPIHASGSTTGTGTSVSGPTLAGDLNGYSLLGISHTAASGTPGSGYLENIDFTNGNGSNIDSLATESKALTVTGNEAGTYTLASSSAWAAVGVTIRPASAENPIVDVSYEYSNVLGDTSQLVEINSETDTTYYVDITSDRAWTPADIPNIEFITTGDTIGGAAAQIDHMFVEVVDTTGSITRISIVQAGRSVT